MLEIKKEIIKINNYSEEKVWVSVDSIKKCTMHRFGERYYLVPVNEIPGYEVP